MCRSSLCRFLLGSYSNPSTPKSGPSSDVAGASSLDPSSAVDDVKTFSEFDCGDGGVKAQSGMDGGSASLDAEAMRISLPFNPDLVRPDTFCAATASYQTLPLSTESPFNTTSFLASCLFRSREHSVNHALLPIASFPHPPPGKPLSDLIVSPVRQSLGLNPETLENMPSLQPGTAVEERARRREATHHQEKSQFQNVLRRADAAQTASPATLRPAKARPQKIGSAKDTQTHDKAVPHPRPSTRPAGQTGVDAQPDPTSLKSTVTPMSWDNPLKNQPHIYNPSPTGRSANHTPAKLSATPRQGGRAQEVTPRRSADSVRHRPTAVMHGVAHVDTKSLSKRPAAPVVSSKPVSVQPPSRPAAAPSSSTALVTVQLPSTHPSTIVVRISNEPLPTTAILPSAPGGPQKVTHSKAVIPAATEIVERSKDRYEEWHKKRANTKYPTEQELYEKLVEEGRVKAIHRPLAAKAIEPKKDTKREKSPVPSLESLKSTAPSTKGSKTSLPQTGSTESLASRHSSKGPRPSTGGPTGSAQVAQKERSHRADRRDARRDAIAGIPRPAVKPSSTSVRRASPSTREGSVKQAHSRPSKAVSNTPFPTAPAEDGVYDDGSLKGAKRPWDGSTRAEERSEFVPRLSTESAAKSSRPSGDSGSRAPLGTSHRAGVEAHQSASDVNSIKTVSSTKSSRQQSPGKRQSPHPSITESLRIVDSMRESSHKPSSRTGTTPSSRPEGARKRSRTLSNTATVDDAPVLDSPLDDWPSAEDLLSEMSPAPTTTGRLQDVSPMKTLASEGKPLLVASTAPAKHQLSGGQVAPSGPSEKTETAPSTHKAFPASGSQVDKIPTSPSDAPLQAASQRSSGVSYLTMNEPPPKDPATPPVTLRAPMARQLAPNSPLLHRCFESIVTDGNTYSVVTDNFDPESYPLGYDFRDPLPSIPSQVASARAEVTPGTLDLPTFTRGRIEPVWPALKAATVGSKPATRAMATVKEVRFTENSSEETLLEHGVVTARQSARFTIFPNASAVTVSTSSGSGSSLSAIPLLSSMEWPMPPSDIPQKGKELAEEPPSYIDSVPSRQRSQSDATERRDKKDRLLLNARLPAPYIDELIRTREANMAFASAQAQREAEQNGRPRKQSAFKKILGTIASPFKKKKEENVLGGLGLTRSVSAQPRPSPSTIHWIAQATRK